MSARVFFFTGILTLTASASLPAQNLKPVLRLEAGGPTSNVTALAFSPDSNTLYAAGFDKVVRVWRLGKSKKFELDPDTSFRVPIHPGTQGAINAVALSSDGLWLAVGGLGILRDGTPFDGSGKLWPALGGLTPDSRQDQGLIYVFHTQKPDVKVLRGHRGPILNLAFAAVRDNQPLRLASAARGWDTQTSQLVGELRLWDVVTAKQIAARLDLPAPVNFRPGLAVFATGAEPKEAGIAVAWGDPHKDDKGKHGYLRTWDVSGNQMQLMEDGYENIALATFPDEKRLLTGSFRNDSGQLQLWQLDGAAATAGKRVVLPRVPGKFLFPRHAAVVASRAEGGIDHAAVVLRDATDAYLDLISLADTDAGARKAQVHLWKNSPLEPLVVSSARGRYLAVAGNADHSIHVFAIRDLLDGNLEPQVLHSIGTSFAVVQFVSRGAGADKLGLAFGTKARPDGRPEVDLVFDFAGRKLSDIEGWKDADPMQEDWRLERDAKSSVVTLWQADKKGQPIALTAEQRLTAHAFVPPRAPWNIPLVAVASYVRLKGTTVLDLYDGRSGQKIRRFDGHLAPIRHVAFSADGKLLASAGTDQTVCVWTLTDLPEILGKFGGIGGLAVEMKNDAVVVAEMDSTGPAARIVKKGQTLVGLVGAQSKLKPFDSPHSVYEALWRTKPGQTITLRLQGEGDARDVPVVVEQGADVRSPLFSLFITRPDKDGKREWLGWSARGPFDSSRPDVEGALGWHFNTGQAKEPARFAPINEYRKEYYRKDILKHLVAHANLAAALAALEPKPEVQRKVPRIQEGIGAARAANGDVLFRGRDGALQFAIHDFEFQKGDVVEWRLDDGPAKTFDGPDGHIWSIPLDKLPATPGRHKVRLDLQLRGHSGQTLTYGRDVTVRYQPPAPRVVLAASQPQLAVRKADFALEAQVHTTLPEQPALIKVLQTVDGKTMEVESTRAVLRQDRPFELKKTLTLQHGANLVQVVAENLDPLEGFADEERDTKALKVHYQSEAPSILVRAVVPLLDGMKTGDAIAVEPGQALWVEHPRVRVAGLIQAEENVLAPAWDLGPDTQRRKLAIDEPSKSLPFQVDVNLKPGEQRIRIFARTAQSKEVSESLAISYRPALPRVVIKSPARAARTQTALVAVEATLVQPRNASPEPFKIKVEYLVNGKPLPAADEVESTAPALPERKLVLKPGNNEIQVRLASAWSTVEQPPEVAVRYVRPPRIQGVKATLVGKNPFVDLDAQVVSPVPLLADQVIVEVNGKAVRYARAEVSSGKDEMWRVQVKEVPLEASADLDVNKNSIRLRVANAEDQSEKSPPVEVVYNTPPPPRPEIVLDTTETTLKEPELNLKFQVKSRKALKRVEVLAGDKVLFRPGDLAQLKTNRDGYYEFATGTLALDWGINRLRVEAVNDGGPGGADMVVTVPPWPVQIDLDQIAVEDAKMETLTHKQGADGKLHFGKASDGHVTLKGKLRWSSKDDAQIKDAHRVLVYVNGFQQLPATLLAARKGERVREFEARLSLPAADNDVVLALPDLKKAAGSSNRHEFSVACGKPTRGQQVHVVIVAPGETDERVLKDKFRKAFAAGKVTQDRFKAGIFESVQLYALTDYVPPLEVLTRLDTIASKLKSRAAQGHANDLVLVYYFGKQSDQRGENYLWTSETEPGAVAASSLKLRELAEKYFARFPGAQVLLLDVFPDGAGKTLESSWYPDHRSCVLRCTSQFPPAARFPLLGALEKAMPRVTWLSDLTSPLSASLASYRDYLPPGLRVQLNPAPIPSP